MVPYLHLKGSDVWALGFYGVIKGVDKGSSCRGPLVKKDPKS